MTHEEQLKRVETLIQRYQNRYISVYSDSRLYISENILCNLSHTKE